MTTDPRASLTALVAAFERHLEVARSRKNPDDPAVIAAATDLAEAFDDYDEELFQVTGVATPLAIYDGPFDDDEDDEDDDDDDDEDDEDDEDDDDDDDDEDDDEDDDDLDEEDDDEDAFDDDFDDEAPSPTR